ncbi:MAG TPA: class I SAM-dependent methyltransferase [Candidatus Paceibacterota bacterium]|nr:class I SAM-dependent methyltransferase [Candidatus Paceibacterota bacterium]
MLKKFLLSKMTRERLDVFIESHASDAYTLDLGCAHSPYSQFFPNRVGLDVYQAPGVDIVGDAHDLPFEDATFECIVCTEVLEHLHTPERALSEMRRVLKENGRIILTTRFVFPIHDAPGDYYRYTEYGLAHLFRDWTDVKIQAESSTSETFGILMQRIAYQTDLRGGILTKTLLLALARTAGLLKLLIKKEYGRRSGMGTVPVPSIMTSGYYVFARK